MLKQRWSHVILSGGRGWSEARNFRVILVCCTTEVAQNKKITLQIAAFGKVIGSIELVSGRISNRCGHITTELSPMTEYETKSVTLASSQYDYPPPLDGSLIRMMLKQ